MRFLTVEQMRAADRAAVDECGIKEETLMLRAGSALAHCVARLACLRAVKKIVLLAGHGNNGGDVFVAARSLHAAGFNVLVVLTCDPKRIRGAAQCAWKNMLALKVEWLELSSVAEWRTTAPSGYSMFVAGGIIVDGILGTGCKGAPEGAAAEAIKWINSMRQSTLIVAADLPSGMNGDTGCAEGDVVVADFTVTFAAPKQGFANAQAASLLGTLLVADIGIPDEIAFRECADEVNLQFVAEPELRKIVLERPRASHKGDYGHLCVIGGAAPYPNAPVLSCAAALRSGAGLVTLYSCAGLSGCALALVPEVIAAGFDLQGFADATELQRQQLCRFESFDAIVVGPGLGRSFAAAKLVRDLLHSYDGALVLDADALNLLADMHQNDAEFDRERPLVLTPHPGEAARLLNCSVKEVQSDRVGAVQKLAQSYHAVAVLKGAGTLISDGDSSTLLNLTGNPGMASAGSGDVLAGMIGALLAQKHTLLNAAALAVWAHGLAGDFAASQGSMISLSATHLIAMLPQVFQEMER